MIAFCLWLGVAHGASFDRASFARIVRERAVLLQLVHRADNLEPLGANDPDRSQTLGILQAAGERGPLYAFLERLGPIEIRSDESHPLPLEGALRREGLIGDGTRMRRQIVFDLLGAARTHEVPPEIFVAEIARYILIPSPMAWRLQSFAAARTSADLIALLGEYRDPAGFAVVLTYLRGLRWVFRNLENVAYVHIAVVAGRKIAPDTAWKTMYDALGGLPAFRATNGDDLDLPVRSAAPSACAARLDDVDSPSRLGRVVRALRTRWLRRP